MDYIARQVCLNAGGDTLTQGGGAETILNVLREYFQPDTLGYTFRQVAEFFQYKRTDQAVERYLLEFGILHRRPGERIAMGSAFPEGFAPILCMRIASL